MKWKRTNKKELPLLLDFLLPRESQAVAVTSRLKLGDRASLPPRREASVFFCQGSAEILAAVLISSTGVVLPVLAPGNALQPESLPRLAELKKIEPSIHSVMGKAGDVAWVSKCLALKPGIINKYHLMSLNRERFLQLEDRALRVKGLALRAAGLQDAERLYPLQKGYELEDVAISKDHFHERSCFLSLKRILRHQEVIMAELNGKAVAKVNTNARGFRVDQVGGMYTIESERNRGIGFLVLKELLKRIFQTREIVSLFVRKNNPAAAALYRNLGFTVTDSYRISYYHI